MKIDNKLNIGDIVKVQELDCKGKVVSLNIDRSGLRYEVRYFYSGDAKYSYFEESELSLIGDSNSSLGF